MAATVDTKVVAAEIGRTGLYKTLRASAEANWMERNYQQSISDLKWKEQIEGMAAEVAALPEAERLAEVLARFVLVLLMQTQHPQQQVVILWQLYTHLRATGLQEPVKPNIGSIVDLSGRRIPPKESA